MKEMLKKINPRYISAVVAILIVVPVFIVIILGDFEGRIFGSVVMLIGAVYGVYEFVKHLKVHKATKILVPFLAIAVVLLDKEFYIIDLIKYGVKNNGYFHLTKMISIYGLSISVVALTIVLLDPVARKENNIFKVFLYVVFIVIGVGLFFRILFATTIINYLLILLLIPVAIFSDTFAYVGGMLLHKKFPKKIAPTISPKKTWVGFFTGYIFAVLYIILFTYFSGVLKPLDVQSHVRFIIVFVLLVILLPLVSPLGDLMFSACKRDMGIKDYGKIMPGHGGLLDRIDSWIAIMITFGIIYQLATL